jgi:hypothetical protein
MLRKQREDSSDEIDYEERVTFEKEGEISEDDSQPEGNSIKKRKRRRKGNTNSDLSSLTLGERLQAAQGLVDNSLAISEKEIAKGVEAKRTKKLKIAKQDGKFQSILWPYLVFVLIYTFFYFFI